MRSMPLTLRQRQALRGARLLELEREKREREKGFAGSIRSRYNSPGQIAGPVSAELPDLPQHGNGAAGKTSWSGRVPYGRILGPACRGLLHRGLMEALGRMNWSENQRSEVYRLTAKGREEADRLLAEVG